MSVVSMALVGKWFRRRLGAAMGVFSVLLTFGFIGSILGMGSAIEQFGWRSAWNGMGLILLALAPVGWLLARDTPEACGLPPDEQPPEASAGASSATGQGSRDFTLAEALRSPVFWIFSAGTASFNLVWSSITLFNESILAERGFDASVAIQIMAILTGCGLVSNLIAGRLATRQRMGRLLGVGLAILAASLAAFPGITTTGQIWMYAVAMGLTGGIVMVVFFAAWGHLFGRSHLGRIQGVAQIVSILASASGPLLLAEWQAATGSYSAMFYVLSAAVGTVSVLAYRSRPPELPQADWEREPALGVQPSLEGIQE